MNIQKKPEKPKLDVAEHVLSYTGNPVNTNAGNPVFPYTGNPVT